SHYKWVRRFINHPRITTRSTVASGIATLYADEFPFERPAVIRNAPPFLDLEPTEPAPGRIRLIHHGVAQWKRGLREVVDAMRLLTERFEMTFMLAGDQRVVDELRSYAADLG